MADAAMGEALAALRRGCTDVRFLGSYPQAVAPEAPSSRARSEPVAEAEGLGVGQGEKD